jgi:hypothetical protein
MTEKRKYEDEDVEKIINDEAAKQAIRQMASDKVAEWNYDDVPPVCLTDVPEDTPPPEFLIEHYCPRSLFLLAGEEGIGKGLCAVWMALQVLRQTQPKGTVLFMSTEDDAAEIHRRFSAAGLPKKDRKRVFHVEKRMSFKALAEFITKHNVQFIVADALRDYTPRAPGRPSNHNDDATVRDGLVQWRAFAQEFDVAIAGIHHTNKMSKDQSGHRTVTRERIGGAGAWQQVVRHVVFLDRRGRRPDDQYALGVVKSNFMPKGFTQEYHIDTVGGLGVRFNPSGEVSDDLEMYDWLLESDTVVAVDALSAEEEYDIVLQALRDTQREDGTLLGAGPLWHEALKDHAQIKKATIPAVLARIRADGLITGHTVRVEWTADVEARLEQELEDKRAELRRKK